MKVLLIGNGAREHAIAWKISQSHLMSELFVAPGNAGTAELGSNVPISATDIDGLLGFAKENSIDFTIVGPEAPLADGIVDRFQEVGLLIFGPTKNAAQIEGSKSFAKELMLLHNVPTATAKTFSSYDNALNFLEASPLPVVVKADGLAAGKGVVVAQTLDEAQAAVHEQMVEKAFGAAGDRVLIEECLEGQEISVFAFVDGERVSPMVAACDYKRIGDRDTGPNTGGMGSYSPPSVWNAALEQRVREEIMEPVARGLVAQGGPYCGILYAGLMLTAEGPKVIEFNCRLGDPETQVILPRLKTDLLEAMMKTAQGKLDDLVIEWDVRACVGVVVASGGYPGAYSTGYMIEGLSELDSDVTVFHAGTQLYPEEGGTGTSVVTNGGRVLTVSALGSTIEEARRKVYANAGRVQFKGAYYRKDIAESSSNSLPLVT